MVHALFPQCSRLISLLILVQRNKDKENKNRSYVCTHDRAEIHVVVSEGRSSFILHAYRLEPECDGEEEAFKLVNGVDLVHANAIHHPPLIFEHRVKN
jgi:hypothetical protein